MSMLPGDWYFCYADDPTSIDGPYTTRDAAIEAAKDQYLEDDDCGADDVTNMLILKVSDRLTVSQTVEVKIETVP